MDLHNPIFSAGESLSGVYLQGLQIAFLRVAEQGGDAMIVPHAANVGVSPQREDLTDDGHPPQRAVNQFHDVRVTHLLRKKTTRGGFSLSSISKHSGVCFIILWIFFFCIVRHHDKKTWLAVSVWRFWIRNKTSEGVCVGCARFLSN